MKKFTITYGFREHKTHAKTVISAHNVKQAIEKCNEDYSFYDILAIYDESQKLLATYANEIWTE